ncbi:MAG: hypothetical protein ACK54H_08880 [Phycisphaerales bacterium]
MDDRLQTGIREGAGREESRYNLEFIDLLQKWGTPVLVVASLAAGGFAAYRHFDKLKTEKLDSAFVELEGAATGGSPESLTAIADQYEGVGSVSMLARIEAAEAYRRSVLSGVKPGGKVEAEGVVNEATDLMTDADKTEFLTKAEALYRQVLTESESERGLSLFTVTAKFGLAAVEESRGAWEKAKSEYEGVIAICEGTSLSTHAEIAKQRIDDLMNLQNQPRVLSRSELPSEAAATPAVPEAAPAPVDVAPAAPAEPAPAPTPAPDAPK